MSKAIDLTGLQFGRLLARERAPSGRYGQAKWKCICVCGNEKSVSTRDLRSGHTKSCGCWRKEQMAIVSTKHNQTGTRLWRIWHCMKQRCCDKNHTHYKNYGGRGITVQDEIRDNFEVFRDWSLANGYNDSLTIDRIDNEKGYFFGNMRWATRETQARNARKKVTNTSGVKGVSWHKRQKKWAASIRADKKSVHLGSFATLREAAEARRQGEIKYWEREG